jgi:hypothetical protein
MGLPGAALLTVYLWDAGTWCGVTGSLEVAQQRAAERIGEDGHGRVEAARVVLGVLSLTRCYERTRQSWTARRRPDGTVSWIPVGRERLRSVS